MTAAALTYDMVIIGGGMVGSALACLLGQAGRRVALIESTITPAWLATEDFELRVSALSRSSQRLLEQVGAWAEVVAQRVAPYEAMQVWDAQSSGQIRFTAAELGEPDLGHIVENRVVQRALLAALARYPSVELWCPAQLDHFERDAAGLTVYLVDGRVLQTRLLVGADGANSRVRELAGIGVEREDYAQQGLVCTVRTALPHQSTAWQRFLPTGPLAFLPLAEPHSCSVVWTLPADQADAVLNWEALAFQSALAAALEERLGAVLASGPRAAFPLRGQQACSYSAERIVLLGDAAHSIHPLAGQGVNLGFKDAAVLAEQLLGVKDPGEQRALRRYERARRGDNVLTQKTMEGFRLLFGNSLVPWQWLRATGMNTLDHLPMLKYQLARQALGV